MSPIDFSLYFYGPIFISSSPSFSGSSFFCRAKRARAFGVESHDGLQGHDGQEGAGCRPRLHRPQVSTNQPTKQTEMLTHTHINELLPRFFYSNCLVVVIRSRTAATTAAAVGHSILLSVLERKQIRSARRCRSQSGNRFGRIFGKSHELLPRTPTPCSRLETSYILLWLSLGRATYELRIPCLPHALLYLLVSPAASSRDEIIRVK